MASPNQVMLLTSIARKLARKVKLNRNRRLRRKRNKKFFLLKLKAKRASRSEDSLCASIADLLDIHSDQTDQTMDVNHINNTQSAGSSSFAQTLQDVAAWQNQHQISFWKSKALSLQMENQMLHKHIKRLYDNQMQQYLNYKNTAWEEVAPQDGQEETTRRRFVNKPEINDLETEVENVEVEMDETALPPSEQPGEVRRRKMVEMYGEKAAKINGMETAMQLNFEYCMNKDKPPYWPNLPLKM